MKLYKNYFSLYLLAFALLALFQNDKLMANSPSSPIWFQQTGFGFDSTSLEYSIILMWKDGLIDDYHPKAEGYYLYRSVIGNNKELEDFDLVATIETGNSTGEILYTDKMMHGAGYFYYLKGFTGNNVSEISPVIKAFSPGAYCVNMDAEIVDILTFPATVGISGENYVYEAFAKHRSFRVQGFVRYSLLESPEGMTLDEVNGRIEWNIPSNLEGDHYVKLKAYSLDDTRAESIQEWYIRLANEQEILLNSTSVTDNSNIDNNWSIYPNPVSDFITIQVQPFESLKTSESSEVQIFNVLGVEVNNLTPALSEGEGVRVDVSQLSSGIYFIKIGDNVKKFVKN